MDKMRDLTIQIRRNQEEVGDFLKDLDSWTKDVKEQDESLRTMKPREQAESAFPPIRSKGIVEKVKKKRQADAKKVKPERIKSSDYRKWERLNVDALLKEVDDEEREMEEEVQLEVEKLDASRKVKVAAEMKEKGNEHFKNRGYEAAIECYTTGMHADPSNPVFPANRAMAYLKLKRYPLTEADCTLALSLDPSYTKAYLRRGTARIALGKLSSARKDFTDALKLEPGNTQAKSEIANLDKLEKVGGNRAVDDVKIKGAANGEKKRSKHVQPIFIPPKLRSKKPLMRVEVQEVGFQDHTKKDSNISKAELNEFVDRKSEGEANMRNTKNSTIPVVCQEHTELSNKFPESEKNRKRPKMLVEEISSDTSTKSPSGFKRPLNGFDNADDGGAISLTNSPQNNHDSTKTKLVPPHPTTSFQFQAHVKQLADDPNTLMQYVFQIPPSRIPSLLKEQLETETLVPVLRCFLASESFDVVLDYLNQFAKVKRFEMAILFMSEVEKKDVRSLFRAMENALPSKMVDIESLGTKYGL